MASFTKGVNSRLAQRPLVSNGRLANRGLTSLVIEAPGNRLTTTMVLHWNLIGICKHGCSKITLNIVNIL